MKMTIVTSHIFQSPLKYWKRWTRMWTDTGHKTT